MSNRFTKADLTESVSNSTHPCILKATLERELVDVLSQIRDTVSCAIREAAADDSAIARSLDEMDAIEFHYEMHSLGDPTQDGMHKLARTTAALRTSEVDPGLDELLAPLHEQKSDLRRRLRKLDQFLRNAPNN